MTSQQIETKDNLAIPTIFLVAILHHVSLFANTAMVVTMAYAVLCATAICLRLAVVFPLVLFMLLWQLGLFLPQLIVNISAIYLAVIFIITLPIIAIWPGTTTLSWFKKGTISNKSKIWMFIIAVVAAASLLVWAAWTDNFGAAENLMKGINHWPKALILFLVIPVFSCLNAFAEEVVYRGIFLEAALQARIIPIIAVLLQASAFAAIHFQAGFPNGFTGYFMTFVYGTALGILRYETKGILAPFITHIMADLVIIYFLYFKFV